MPQIPYVIFQDSRRDVCSDSRKPQRTSDRPICLPAIPREKVAWHRGVKSDFLGLSGALWLEHPVATARAG